MVQNISGFLFGLFCFCFYLLRGKQRALFAKGLDLPCLPRIFIFPSCFHSILLQFATFTLQQFNEMGLLSHTTFLSSMARIRMGVTSSLLASPYSKISNVSLQRYSPVKSSQDYELLSLLWIFLNKIEHLTYNGIPGLIQGHPWRNIQKLSSQSGMSNDLR